MIAPQAEVNRGKIEYVMLGGPIRGGWGWSRNLADVYDGNSGQASAGGSGRLLYPAGWRVCS